MKVRAGTRLKSTVCSTEVMVVKAPGDDVEITCGGAPMADPTSDQSSGDPAPDASDGTLLGKRYIDADGSLELLCTKAGDGTLGADGEPLGLQETKPLPASD